MTDLLERSDPAVDLETNYSRLRSKVDARIGLTAELRPAPRRSRRGWLVAAGAFAIVIALAVPAVFRLGSTSVFDLGLRQLGDLPGIETVIPLASGGIQTMAVDGDTIWAMTALQNKLQRVSTISGAVEGTFDIDGHVEGVIVGGGYLWLLSYDNGGEILRFDLASEVVDATIPIGGLPVHGAAWFGDRFWVSNDQSRLFEVSIEGEVLSTSTGELKGRGLGYLWVNDPATDLISSLSAEGARGEIVIPTFAGLETMAGSGVRSVTEAGGFLWLMDGDFPWGTNLSRFDIDTGELDSVGDLTFGLLGMAEFEEALWVTSNTDHLLLRVDPETSDIERYPLPGKPGGLAIADGSLWVTLHQPGTLLRLDPSTMIRSGDVVFDDWKRFPHRLLCTGSTTAGGPTLILEPFDWVDYGSWSVVQAKLANEGYVVCANGYVEGEKSPAQRAAELGQALAEAGINGPYVLVAAGDGVHTIRLFADGRNDIAGVILVDPMPLGFQDFYDDLVPDLSAHPMWLDLESTVSDSLTDFGEAPLTIIGQDPDAVFMSTRFVTTAGRMAAESINQAWQDGLDFYASLSTNSVSLVASGSGLDSVVSSHPDLIVQEVLGLLSMGG